MSREPRTFDRDATGRVGGEVSAASSAAAPYRTASGPPHLTINNFNRFPHRVKMLPPDANINAAINTKLYQFKERMCFSCVKCRRDNIHSDVVAADLRQRIILCAMCFTRMIRPRVYRPSRVVPFPSLLSWLDYKPSKAVDVEASAVDRPAEAVVPSGDRIAAPSMLSSSGDAIARISALPAIATKKQLGPVSTSTSSNAAYEDEELEKHPCLRLWGACLHGPTCLFRNAPGDLCLGHLMGLCPGDEDCKKGLLHQAIYDLPRVDGLQCPSDPRCVGDEEEDGSAWSLWVQQGKRSTNLAEWQLWNNGSIQTVLDFYLPPAVEREGAVEIHLNDILSALKSID